MNYAIEILLEQKELLTEELKFAEGEERTETEQRLIAIATALNTLNLPDVMPSFSDFEITDKAIEYAKEFEIRNKPIETAKIQGYAVRDYYAGFKAALNWA